MRRIVDGIAVVILLAGIAAVCSTLFGCASASTQTKRTLIFGAYTAELETCSIKAKEAGDYRVFEVCADATDERFGLRKGEHDR